MKWLLILALALPCGAAVLEWDAVTNKADGTLATNVAGYRVYSGRLSRQYNISTNSTTNTTFTFTNLTGTTFFAVTAFDTDGLENEYSNEVSWTVPGVAPWPPLNLRIRATNAVSQIRLLQSTDLVVWRETGIAFVAVADGTTFFRAAAPKPAKAFISAAPAKSGKLTAPSKRPAIGPPPMPPK